MEHEFLIKLTIRYDLDDDDIVRVVEILEQLGYDDFDEKESREAARALCEKDILDLPDDEIIDEMKRDGFGDGF